MLDQQDALPQQVDEAAGAILALDRHLEAGDAPAVDAEDGEERIPERLGLGILAGLVLPFLGERDGSRFDFVPAQRHDGSSVCGRKDTSAQWWFASVWEERALLWLSWSRNSLGEKLRLGSCQALEVFQMQPHAAAILATILCVSCGTGETPLSEDARLVRTEPQREPIVYALGMSRGVVNVVDGCVRLQHEDGRVASLVFPPDYRLVRERNRVTIQNNSGRVLYSLGDVQTVGGSALPDDSAARLVPDADRQICGGPYYLVLPHSD